MPKICWSEALKSVVPCRRAVICIRKPPVSWRMRRCENWQEGSAFGFCSTVVGRAAQRHAGGRSGIDGIQERDGDIARPRGAVQVLAFEMEDTIDRNGEVVAGERHGERAFCGNDDRAGAEGARLLTPLTVNTVSVVCTPAFSVSISV